MPDSPAPPAFNLVDEPWIKVRFLDGRRGELGLLELFRQAGQIAAIEHDSPLVVLATLRLLLAILYRALRPATTREVADWWVRGWPLGRIEEYLGQWRGCFGLFDARNPFFQVADLAPAPKDRWPWCVLALENNAYPDKLLFSHTVAALDGCAAIPPAEAAGQLLAAQCFVPPGGRGYCVGPSASALLVAVTGDHLGETLLLNLVPTDGGGGGPPVWERPPATADSFKAATSRRPHGTADLYAWPSRQVRLFPEADGTVRHVAFAAGMKCEWPEGVRDPQTTHVPGKDNVYQPLGLKKGDRGIWRDFPALLPSRSSGAYAPAVMHHAADLLELAGASSRALSFMAGGRKPDNQAKMLFWRLERFVLPGGAFREQFGTFVRKCLENAEGTAKALHEAGKDYARELLRRDGQRKIESEDIEGVAASLPCSRLFWRDMERAFHTLLADARRYQERDPAEVALRLGLQWLVRLRSALMDAWSAHERAVTDAGGAWALRAVFLAGRWVGRHVKRLNKQIDVFSKDLDMAVPADDPAHAGQEAPP